MQLQAETYKDYLMRLRKLNITEIGDGGFGRVFQHPEFSNVAVKVVRSDTQYLRFARFARRHPANPYLPKIADIVSVHFDDSKDGFIVFTERLRPAPAKLWLQFQEFLPKSTWPWSLAPNSVKRLSSAGWQWLAAEAQDTNVREFATFAFKNMARLDLSQSNLMARGSQLVFTDPVS